MGRGRETQANSPPPTVGDRGWTGRKHSAITRDIRSHSWSPPLHCRKTNLYQHHEPGIPVPLFSLPLPLFFLSSIVLSLFPILPAASELPSSSDWPLLFPSLPLQSNPPTLGKWCSDTKYFNSLSDGNGSIFRVFPACGYAHSPLSTTAPSHPPACPEKGTADLPPAFPLRGCRHPLHPKPSHELRPRHPLERHKRPTRSLSPESWHVNVCGALVSHIILAPLRVEVPLQHEIEVNFLPQSLIRSLRI